MQGKAEIDEIRTLAFGGISGAYAPVGAVLGYPTRIVTISNGTEGDLFFTDNITKDKMYVAAGTARVIDFQSNKDNKESSYRYPAGARFYVKQIEAPVSGSVYIECIY